MAKHPKIIFLIDGLGALLSAFMLGFVLSKFESFFGLPKAVLWPLSIIACFFAINSIAAFLFIKNKSYLKVIAIANIAYCVLSVALLFKHYNTIHLFGVAYIMMEVVLIFLLALIELKIATSKEN